MDVLGFLVMSRGGLFFLFRAAVVCVESENESRSVASDSLQPQRRYSARNSPGQNTGVGSLSLLQGIFPARGSSHPRDQTQVSHIVGKFFTSWATKEAQEYWSG